jgi:hypothetical protein
MSQTQFYTAGQTKNSDASQDPPTERALFILDAKY